MIRLRTLGSVDIDATDGRVLDAVRAQPKRLALLVYLAAARPGPFHRRDRLLALFWPELDEARARDALSQALRFLRQALGAEVVLTRGVDEVGIDGSRLSCDAVEFRTAIENRRADAPPDVYGGDFLDGFFVEDASGFEEWVESERAALRELAARGARQLAELYDQRGAHTAAVAWGRRAVELAADDERAFRRLLGLLDRAGDRAGALQAYDAFAERLRTEYDAEPAAETQALADAIRRQSRVPPVASGTPREPVAAPAPVPLAYRDGEPAPPETLAVGASLSNGRYLIQGILGTGGMATVYVAHDVRHERRVAIKVLRPEIAAGVGARVLLREIRIAASLQHPHIVPLFDSGECDGQVFYVMPHVIGESLRVRLQRERPIPIESALRIARDMAEGLAYAHGRGVIHRDIKPDNVLLSGDASTGDLHALITDFGVARALDPALSRTGGVADGWLTMLGMVGTPAYMAPEQAAGAPVDCRADLYGWGLVVYELLAGHHPFAGCHSPHQLLAAHIAERPTPLSGLPLDAAPALSALVMRCLEKHPDARPADGRALLAELDRIGDRHAPGATPVRWLRRRSGLAIGALAGLAAIAAASWIGWRLKNGRAVLAAETPHVAEDPLSVLDTARYAILPFVYDSTATRRLNEVERLRDAISRWSGVTLVDEFRLGEALSRGVSQRLTPSDAQQLASRFGAGRYVWGDVRGLGESIRAYAGLYDTRTNALVRDTAVRMGGDPSAMDSLFQLVADHLLLGAGDRSPRRAMGSGTRSLPARQAFARAQAALQQWDLVAADSQFFAATRFDDRYVEAWLWLAQIRSWRRSPPAEWKYAADHAFAERAHLSVRDVVLAEALAATARGDLERACTRLASLTRQDRFDFVGWYAVSDCLARDDFVVRDAASPSGWRFRTSYHQSTQAYRRALELLPSMHRALRSRGFERVRLRLKTSGNSLRGGRGTGPDSGQFYAYPAWQGDTIAYTPYPAARFERGDSAIIPSSVPQAVRQQRRVFHDIATVWATESPESSDAQEALAISLQLLGDQASLDTLRRARRLATDRSDRVRLAADEVWMRVRFALPGYVAELRSARALADSLLRATNVDSIDDARPLASLAALTGRANLAASLSRHRSVRAAWGVPPALGDIAPALWVFAAFGGPSDTLAHLEERFGQILRTKLTAQEAEAARDAWLTRASALAFPEYRFAVLSQEPREDASYLQRAASAVVRNDSVTARRILDDLARTRRRIEPADRTVDALCIEAHVLQALGDRAAAVAWIEPTLDALSAADPTLFADPMRAAPLVRTMALRAELAADARDRESARRWAEAVSILWSDADAFLRPTVRRMAALTRMAPK